jgi:hypothetical protein
MGYSLDGPGSILSSARYLSSLQYPDLLWGPSSLPLNGCHGLISPMVTQYAQYGRVADHSAPSSAEVK